MNLLQILLTLYLLTGVVYAGYVLTQRSFSIFMLPVNIIGGPILAIYYLIKYYLLKDRGPANIRHKDILKGKITNRDELLSEVGDAEMTEELISKFKGYVNDLADMSLKMKDSKSPTSFTPTVNQPNKI